MNNISGVVNTVNNNMNISGIASPNVNASRFGSNYNNNTMNNFLSNNNYNSAGFSNVN